MFYYEKNNLSQFSEKKLVESSALKLLQDELGWIWKKPNEICRKNEKYVFSHEELRLSLKKLNSWINEDQINEAIQCLLWGIDQPFNLSINKEKYYLIRDGIDVTVKEKGVNSTRRAKIIDFKTPENNLFSAVSQLRIKSYGNTEYICRPDFIGFVNGIPLLFGEFKSHYISPEEAYNKNYLKYLKEIPQLFAYNAFCILSSGMESKMGAVGSSYEFFHDWHRLKEEDSGSNDISTLLRGICKKENLLDFFENFILFSKSKDTVSKVIARNHQYLGVNKAFESYKLRSSQDGKIGTFWHTQGSGKSLSMLLLAEKIKRKCEGKSPLFIILLDRKELERQIYDTFLSYGVLGSNINCIVNSRKELEMKIKENHSYVFSLIHKFERDKITPLKTDKEILIMVDEAHRTQYGNMATAMYNFLPKVSKLGFTATPLFKREEITAKSFGDYVSTYDFVKAVHDKVTVPLFYEHRALKIKDIENPQINHDFYLLREKKELPKDWKSNKYLWMNENRLRSNAKDFVDYYSNRFFDWNSYSSIGNPTFVGKALYVCLNRRACILMKNFVQEYWKEEIKRLKKSLKNLIDDEYYKVNYRIQKMEETKMEIVFSDGDLNEEEIYKCYGEDIELPQSRTDSELRKIEDKFKKKEDVLRIAFVCNMWLTGFDVQCLTFLFLDKALEAHTLMQAIARPNRKDVGKDRAFIIDYLNCFLSLKKALEKWGISNPNAILATKKPEEIIQNISKFIKGIEKFLLKQDIFLNNLIEEKNAEEKRKMLTEFKEKLLKEQIKNEFNNYCLQLFNELKWIVKDQLSWETHQKSMAIRAIYNHLNSRADDKRSRDCDPDIFEILRKYVSVGKNEENILKDISDIQIKKASSFIVHESRRKEIHFENLKHKTSLKIKEVLDKNPTLINYFNEYNELIEKWNKSVDPEELQKIFNDMLQLSKKVLKEDSRYKDEGFESVSELSLSDISKQNLKEENKDIEEELIRIFAKKIFKDIIRYFREVDNPFEKEVTSSEVKTLLRNNIFREYPAVLNEEKTNALRDSFFNYLKDSFNKPWFLKSKSIIEKQL